MALSKVNFNSMNVTPAASKAIKFNSSNNGLETGDIGGNLVLLATQTASSSGTLSFTSDIDSTYKEYIFKFIDIHPSVDESALQFNMSTDGGSNYNVTKTTNFFQTWHNEADTETTLEYASTSDLAQSTGFQRIAQGMGNDNDQCVAGTLHLFDPSNTTFVKHFLCETNNIHADNASYRWNVGGYCNTTTAIDGIQFKMTTGNIDSGTFKLYGVN